MITSDEVYAVVVLTKLNGEVSSRLTSKQEGVRQWSVLGLLYPLYKLFICINFPYNQ